MNPQPPTSPDAALMAALARLVRGLSALFWGLPVALILCVQTAKGDWLQPLGILPPVAATGLVFYGLVLLGAFRPQERVWIAALDHAKLSALAAVGLSPFLFWWNRLPHQAFYLWIVELLVFDGLVFLLLLNRVLWRLVAMLPDETLRLETRLFTTLNRYFLAASILFLGGYLVLMRLQNVPHRLLDFLLVLNRSSLWLELFLVLLPVATTMAMLWKVKEIILNSVFTSR
ncbi:MAG: hypothetical protein JXQ71_16555 [Verrucomicrobia bacterium]|nr:hypothetical protein [Verrucomicrobiota bacterium]